MIGKAEEIILLLVLPVFLEIGNGSDALYSQMPGTSVFAPFAWEDGGNFLDGRISDATVRE